MSAERPEIEIREATPQGIAEVMSIIDAAMLSVSTPHVRSLIESDGDGVVLRAVVDDRTLGVLVLDGDEIEAVAVRPKRRGQGVGSALVEAASERVEGGLVASFDPDVLPFYEHLGFEVEAVDGTKSAVEDRFRAWLE